MKSNRVKRPASSGAAFDRGELVSRLNAAGHTPEFAGSICQVPRKHYVDPDYFAAETTVLFRKYPTYVGHSAEISAAGDYKTLKIAGVPLLIVRGGDGVARGFRNTCRHRGAPVMTTANGNCGNGGGKMICHYHGWTYDTRGALVGVPLPAAFPNLDRKANGLGPIRVQEKYGLIFAIIDDDAPDFDLVDHLGDLGPQFDSIGLAGFKPALHESIVAPTNWKLAWETFGESYHVPALHPRLLAIIPGSGLAYDSFGPHGRITLPLAGLPELLAQPKSRWAAAESGVHILFHYLLFPNIVVTLMDGAAQIQNIAPGRHVGEAVTTQTQVFAPTLSEEKKNTYGGFFNFSLHDLTANEDYPMAAGIYESLVAGSLQHTTLGRAEWPLHLFHQQRQRLMAAAGFA